MIRSLFFDRIRENLGRTAAKQTPELLAEVANKSLTQTLSRSINTSLTTFVMVFMLFLLGVASIREFALPLMAGLLCGAYSSICIAETVVHHETASWQEQTDQEIKQILGAAIH